MSTPKTSSKPLTKHWCLTLNNYTPSECETIATLCDGPSVDYAVVAREVSSTGTPHLQMHISFSKKLRLTAVKKLISARVHAAERRGTPAQSSDYCKKDGDFDEYGKLPPKEGARSDLSKLLDALNSGSTDEELHLNHGPCYAKYYKYVAHHRALEKAKKPFSVSDHPLREWQQVLNAKLNGPIDSRSIIFIVDKEGNTGKSWFSKYYATTHPETKVQIMKPARAADMAYELSYENRVLFIDCPRSKIEYLQYDFLEAVKDGLVFSPKYESTTKRLDNCHVVCFMNEHPDMSKLSNDRYDVTELN